MKSLSIVYNPESGYTLPDNRIENYVTKILLEFDNGDHPITLHIGSQLMFDVFRLALKERRIDKEYINFYYKTCFHEMKINNNLDLNYKNTEWLNDKILNKLAGWE